MCRSVGMADYSTVPPPSSGSAGGGGGGGVNDAFKDALQRARQVSVDRAAGFPESRWRGRAGPARTPGCGLRTWRLRTGLPAARGRARCRGVKTPPPSHALSRSVAAGPPLPQRGLGGVRPAPGPAGPLPFAAGARKVLGAWVTLRARRGCLVSGPRRALRPRCN